MTVKFVKGTIIDLLGGALVCVLRNTVNGFDRPIGTVVINRGQPNEKTFVPGDPAFQKQRVTGDLELEITGTPTVDSNGNFWVNI